MKIYSTLFILLFSCTLFVSCSEDENDSSTQYNLMPTQEGNSWTYNVTTTNLDEETEIGSSTDEISYEGTSQQNNDSYHDYSSSEGSTGFMSNLFDQNYFKNSSDFSKYYMFGNLNFPFSELGGTDIDIALNDIILIDQNMNDGVILSEQSENSTQTIQTFTLNIDLSVKTIQNERISSYTVNNTAYTNVIASSIIITAKASTPITIGPITADIDILPEQDVYVIKNYYADQIGLIESTATFSYELADLSQYGIELPMPSSGGIISNQEITSYIIN